MQAANSPTLHYHATAIDVNVQLQVKQIPYDV